MHSRTNSQTSIVASQSSFLSTASKLVSSVLGGGKKNKNEPVKSLQLAAAAAKKASRLVATRHDRPLDKNMQQQEQAGQKALRLKEMEARRQQAAQKRADDDKAREEKRQKEEADRKSVV